MSLPPTIGGSHLLPPARASAGGGGSGPLTSVQLTQAHLDAGTFVGTNSLTKTLVVTGGKLTATYNSGVGATPRDGHREGDFYYIDPTEIYSAFDATLHEFTIFIVGDQGQTGTPADFAANTTIHASVVENPGASQVGIGVYAGYGTGPRSFYVANTSSPNGGVDNDASRAVGVFTNGDQLNGTDRRWHVTTFNSWPTYAEPSREYQSQSSAICAISDTWLAFGCGSLGAVVEDAVAAATIWISFYDILATPS